MPQDALNNFSKEDDLASCRFRATWSLHNELSLCQGATIHEKTSEVFKKAFQAQATSYFFKAPNDD